MRAVRRALTPFPCAGMATVPLTAPPTPAAVTFAKTALRAAVESTLRARPAVAVAADSARIVAAVQRQAWLAAQPVTVSCYLPMPHEVATTQLVRAALDAGSTVFAPRVTGRRAGDMAMLHVASAAELAALPLDKWGIPTPGEAYVNDGGGEGCARVRWPCLPPGAPPLSLVVVPGVAFDVLGARLGHGKGYYGERGSLWQQPRAAGVAREMLRVYRCPA